MIWWWTPISDQVTINLRMFTQFQVFPAALSLLNYVVDEWLTW